MKKDRQIEPVPRSSLHDSVLDGEGALTIAENMQQVIEAAWAEYGKRLYWFALSMVCRANDAEDVLQNVFLGIVRAMRGTGEIKNMRAYLYRAVRNEALRLKRMRANESGVDIDDLPLLVAANQQTVEEAMDVSRALAKLPTEQREVVVLKLFHDMTFDEIASLGGISLNTAASRYRYGVAKMRRSMEARQEV